MRSPFTDLLPTRLIGSEDKFSDLVLNESLTPFTDQLSSDQEYLVTGQSEQFEGDIHEAIADTQEVDNENMDLEETELNLNEESVDREELVEITEVENNYEDIFQNQLAPNAQGLATLLYGGFDLKRGDDDRTGKYGGTISTTAKGRKFVAQLQDDLRALGFGHVGAKSDGQFGTNTELAVREFQIHAKMDTIAEQTFNLARIYSDSLVSVPNGSVYTGPVSGVVNATTRMLLNLWQINNWRCPVVIEAWTMKAGAMSTNVHSNLWQYNDLNDTRPRMFARDFSLRYQTGTTRPLADRQVLGDYSKYLRWSGPRSVPPAHTWNEAEVLPDTNLFPAIKPALPLAVQLSPTQLSASELSTFRVVRAVAEVESEGFYDGLNAYDNVYLSIPLFHGVLGEFKDAFGGELGGFISFFAEIFPAEFNRLFGFCGITATKPWSGDGKSLFRTQRRFVSTLNIENEGGTSTSIDKENETIYHWFRSWHWFYRFAMAGRTSSIYKQALWRYARTRLRGLLSTPWDGTLQVGAGATARPATIGDIFTSEKSVAAILRWHVRFPGHITNGNVAGRVLINAALRTGIKLTSPLTISLADEENLVQNLLAQTTDPKLRASVTETANWPTWVPASINPKGSNRNPRGYTLDLSFCNGLSASRNAGGFPLDTSNLPPAP